VGRLLSVRLCPALNGDLRLFVGHLWATPVRLCVGHSWGRIEGVRAVESRAMATTFADLEARVRGLESRTQRAEEDVTAIVTTVVEIRDDVKWLKRAVHALLVDRNLSVPENDESSED
jgi:hypothetical protein